MAIHCQLLLATILYIVVFCNHIAILSTIIHGKSNLDGYCYLFMKKTDGASPSLTCGILINISGIISIYAGIMAIYHGFGTYTASRDNHIGRTMWVMPWLLINSFLVVLTLLYSGVYSVGLYLTCDDVAKYSKKFSNCAYDVKEFQPMVIAEVTSWISVFLWICLVVVEAVRLRRNRRAKAREVYVEPTNADTVRIGDILPTA